MPTLPDWLWKKKMIDRIEKVKRPDIRSGVCNSICAFYIVLNGNGNVGRRTVKEKDPALLQSPMVKTSGLEPPTPCMSSKYSNQLSYAFISERATIITALPPFVKGIFVFL